MELIDSKAVEADDIRMEISELVLISTMRKFLSISLALALGFFGAMVLSQVSKGFTMSEHTAIEKVAKMTSMESNDSNTVEADGLRIEISEPDLIVLPMPENRPDAHPLVKLGLLITNHTPTPFRFNPYGTLIPELVAPDGQVLRRQVATDRQEGAIQMNLSSRPGEGFRFARFISHLARLLGRSETRESDCNLVMPGEEIVVSLNARLSWQNNELQLVVPIAPDYFEDTNKPDKSWSFEALQPGTYQLRFIYDTSSGTRPGADPERREVRTAPEMRSGQLATPRVNLRLVQPVEPDRRAVEVDGIHFETLVPERVVSVPEKECDAKTAVQLGIRITNNTPTPRRFSFYATLTPELVAPDGQILQGGYRSLGVIGPKESDFPLSMPGESVTFFPDSTLYLLKCEQLTLSIAAGDGGFRSFEALKLGRYQVRFRYSNKNEVATIYDQENRDTRLIEGLWTGMVSTPFVEFLLVQP